MSRATNKILNLALILGVGWVALRYILPDGTYYWNKLLSFFGSENAQMKVEIAEVHKENTIKLEQNAALQEKKKMDVFLKLSDYLYHEPIIKYTLLLDVDTRHLTLKKADYKRLADRVDEFLDTLDDTSGKYLYSTLSKLNVVDLKMIFNHYSKRPVNRFSVESGIIPYVKTLAAGPFNLILDLAKDRKYSLTETVRRVYEARKGTFLGVNKIQGKNAERFLDFLYKNYVTNKIGS